MKSIIEFLKEFAWPFGLLLGAFGIVAPQIPPTSTISVSHAVVGALIFAAIILTQWSFLVHHRQVADPQALKIEQVLNGGQLFLIQKNDVLGNDMGALIYLREGRYERLVGEGVVLTVQADGRTQLAVSFAEGLEAALQLQIAQNADGTREKLLIRPGVLMKGRRAA